MVRLLRILFLVLVTIGAFAAVFGVIAVVGLARLSVANAPSGGTTQPAAPTPPAPANTVQGETTPATHPAGPVVPAAPAGVAAADPAPVAAAVPPAAGDKPNNPGGPGAPGAADPATKIVLNAADARVRGTALRRNGETHDLISWTRASDWADWAVETPPGEFHPYHVDLTYACAPGHGGDFEVGVADQTLAGHTESTGSVKDFKTVRVGVLRIPGGKNRLSLKPANTLQHDLMRLRRIELIPAKPGDADLAARPNPAPPVAPPANPPANAPANPPANPPAPDKPGGTAVGFTLIETQHNTPIQPLTDAMTVDLGALPKRHMSIRADVEGNPGSVRFGLDGKERLHVENNAPYAINSDDNGRYVPWTFPVGDHTLTATPFTGKNATGDAGKALTIHFKVVPGERNGDGEPRAPVVLKAEDAKLHGDGIRVEDNGGSHNVGYWSSTDQWVEWEVHPKPGKYTVRLTFAAENGAGGGDFEVTAGDQKLNGSVGPTGGWQQYHVIDLNALSLPAEKVTLRIKPTKLEGGRALMNLKQVELVPQ